MRDPNRIDKFCDELAKLWHKVPDWRFGQLMMNLFATYKIKYSAVDWFNAEDNELINFFKEYFNKDAESWR